MTEKITTTIDYNYLDKFSNEVLNLNKSNRWVGVTNEIGIQLIEKYRAGSKEPGRKMKSMLLTQ